MTTLLIAGLSHDRPAPIIHGCSQAIRLGNAALRWFETMISRSM
jgi:hypothetical protein